MDLLLIRHGHYEGSTVDEALSATGMKQARQVAKRLQNLPITGLVSSPLLRALGTANGIAVELGYRSFEVWLELHEGLFVEYQGYGRKELQQRFPLAHLPKTMYEKTQYYEAETQEDMLVRCRVVLARLHEQFMPTDTIALVAHGGFITYLLHSILNIDPVTPAWFASEYGGIAHIRLVPRSEQQAYPPLYPPMAVEVLSINDVSHLRESE